MHILCCILSVLAEVYPDGSQEGGHVDFRSQNPVAPLPASAAIPDSVPCS